jgi:hypothetical protein
MRLRILSGQRGRDYRINRETRSLSAVKRRTLNVQHSTSKAECVSINQTSTSYIKHGVGLADALRHDLLQVFHVFGRSIMMLHFGAVARDVSRGE